MATQLTVSGAIMELERIARLLEIPPVTATERAERFGMADDLQQVAEQLYRIAGRVRREARRDV